MSMITLRDIIIDPFDQASVERAYEQVKEIEGKLQPALDRLVEQMAKKGVEIAKAELIFFSNPAYDTGELSDSVRAEVNGSEATVAAGYEGGAGYYAAFVEYGTGAVGGMQSDGSVKKGYRQSGWVYFNDRIGSFVFTMGMAARPFMQNTYSDLLTEAEVAGGRIIAEYLA